MLPYRNQLLKNGRMEFQKNQLIELLKYYPGTEVFFFNFIHWL